MKILMMALEPVMKKKWVRSLLLSCSAVAITIFLGSWSIEVLPGSPFRLLRMPTLIIAGRLGPAWGTLVALFGVLVTINEPDVLVVRGIGVLEACFVGMLVQKRPRVGILLSDAVFWPVLGLPLQGLLYYWL